MRIDEKLKNIKMLVLALNRFKNVKIAAKVVMLVLVMQFITIGLFSYFTGNSEELRLRKDVDEKLEVIAYAVNDFVLQEYHDRILDKNSISNDEYLDLLVRLSSFANKADVKYIYSYVKRDSKVLYTSNSATDEEFKKSDYELFFGNYNEATQELIESFEKKNIFYEETTDDHGYVRTIFIPFMNKYGEEYVVGIDIAVDQLEEMNSKNKKQTIILATILFLMSAIVSTLLINALLKRIVVIRNGLQDFFDYLGHKKDSVTPIDTTINDELGEMGKLINENIKVISENMQKDNELIHEITTISEEVKLGSFSSRIDTKAVNPALNDVKNIINDVFSNMQIVMLDILNLLQEFAKQNYNCKLDDYNLDGEMGKLVIEINMFSKKTSDYMLNKAYDTINLDKDSNFLNEHVEELTERLYKHLKDLNELKEVLEDVKRFNTKSLHSTQDIEKQKLYVDELLENLKNRITEVCSTDREFKEREKIEISLEIDEIISDISRSMEMISTNKDEVYKFIDKKSSLMDSLSKSFDFYESSIVDMKQSVDNTKKISSNLKELSQRMREYIENSDFPGKESINILINNTDR